MATTRARRSASANPGARPPHRTRSVRARYRAAGVRRRQSAQACAEIGSRCAHVFRVCQPVDNVDTATRPPRGSGCDETGRGFYVGVVRRTDKAKSLAFRFITIRTATTTAAAATTATTATAATAPLRPPSNKPACVPMLRRQTPDIKWNGVSRHPKEAFCPEPVDQFFRPRPDRAARRVRGEPPPTRAAPTTPQLPS